MKFVALVLVLFGSLVHTFDHKRQMLDVHKMTEGQAVIHLINRGIADPKADFTDEINRLFQFSPISTISPRAIRLAPNAAIEGSDLRPNALAFVYEAPKKKRKAYIISLSATVYVRLIFARFEKTGVHVPAFMVEVCRDVKGEYPKPLAIPDALVQAAEASLVAQTTKKNDVLSGAPKGILKTKKLGESKSQTIRQHRNYGGFLPVPRAQKKTLQNI